MNVILVSDRMSKAVTLGPSHLAVLGVLAALAVLGLLSAASWGTYEMTRRLGWHMPSLPSLPGTPVAQQRQIDALAVKLGQMQAQMVRLDGLTRQVAGKTGIDAKPFQSTVKAPQGGARPLAGEHSISYAELLALVQATDHSIEAALDQYGLFEAVMTQQKLNTWQTPTSLPMPSSLRSSQFGWRIDPFNGRQTFHEGIDFLGDVGTPIRAAAGGRVVTAEYHSEYGNMVEVDHGNGISSRYAHASKLLVTSGQMLKAGDKLALLGSTGRSTGPHLHFEIRYKGVPQNPAYFVGFSGASRVVADNR